MSLCLNNDVEQMRMFRKLQNGKGVQTLIKDKRMQALGYNSKETFEWLWKKYTGNPFDLVESRIDQADINVFEIGIREFKSKVGKRRNSFEEMFYLPKALTKGIKGGEEFVTAIGEAVSYNQRQLKQGSVYIKNMTDGLYKMMADANSPIMKGESFSKADFAKLQNLERALLMAPKGEAKKTLIYDIMSLIGSGSEADPVGGRVLRRFQKILTGEVKHTEMTKIEKDIEHQWNILRSDSMRNLLNGSIAAKRTIETLLETDPNRKDLLRAYDKIQGEIENLLLSAKESNKIMDNTYYEANGIFLPNKGKALQVRDPKTNIKTDYFRERQVVNDKGETTTEKETFVGIKKYSPGYVLELTDIMMNLTDFAKNTNAELFNGMTSREIRMNIEKELDPTRISNRLKSAANADRYKALDPVYYLSKYVQDVASWNMRSRINFQYSKVTKDLWEATVKNNHQRGDAEIGEYSRHLIDMITEIKGTALMNNGGPKTVIDEAIRAINAFEYAAKIGFSVKSGLKNRMQGLQNWVQFGFRGYRITENFKAGSDREYTAGKSELNNEAMIKRQMKKYGMMIGEKQEAASISAATKGSLDFMLVPEGFGINERGQLVVAKDRSSVSKVADKLSKVADISSKYTPLGRWFSQMSAENTNRIKTFEMAFSHAFLGEKNNLAYHEKVLFEKLGRTPTKEEVYDRIEKLSGKQAFEMVKMLHFDYDNWAKARILRKGTLGGAGQVMGQFQHFKFAFFDYQFNMYKDMTRNIQGQRWKIDDPINPGQKMVNPEITKMIRMTSLYSIIPVAIAMGTGFDLGGIFSTFGKGVGFGGEITDVKGTAGALLDNPIIEEASFLYTMLTADDSTLEGMIDKYDSNFGKPFWARFTGPFVGSILTVAELTDFLNLVPEEYEQLKGMNLEALKDSPASFWYQVARIFNIQGARTFWQTIPNIRRDRWDKALKAEFGLYKPKYLEGFRENVLRNSVDKIYEKSDGLPRIWRPKVNPKDKIRSGRKKTGGNYKVDDDINKKALESLQLFTQ